MVSCGDQFAVLFSKLFENIDAETETGESPCAYVCNPAQCSNVNYNLGTNHRPQK